jgi:hypothetical protein
MLWNTQTTQLWEAKVKNHPLEERNVGYVLTIRTGKPISKIGVLSLAFLTAQPVRALVGICGCVATSSVG